MFPSKTVEFDFDSAITWSDDDHPSDVSTQVAAHLGEWVARHTNLVMHIARPPDGTKCIALGRLPDQTHKDLPDIQLEMTTGGTDPAEVVSLIVVDAHAPPGSKITHVAVLLLNIDDKEAASQATPPAQETSRPALELAFEYIDHVANLVRQIQKEEESPFAKAFAEGLLSDLDFLKQHLTSESLQTDVEAIVTKLKRILGWLEKSKDFGGKVIQLIDLMRRLAGLLEKLPWLD